MGAPRVWVVLYNTLKITHSSGEIRTVNQERGKTQQCKVVLRVKRDSLFPTGLGGCCVSTTVCEQTLHVIHFEVSEAEQASRCRCGVEIVGVQRFDGSAELFCNFGDSIGGPAGADAIKESLSRFSVTMTCSC